MEDPRVRPPWQGEVVVVAVLLLVYDRIADLRQLHVGPAIERGRALLAFERWAHVDVELTLDHFTAARPWLGELMALYYDLANVTVTMTVLVGVFGWAPRHYRPARRALVLINLTSLAVFLALPVAPPRLLPGAGFVDVIAGSGPWSAWQSGSGIAEHANQYASMPSLHVAWAVWVLLTVYAAVPGRTCRGLAWGHVVLTVSIVLLTGNHYVLDIVAGSLVAGGCWVLVGARPGRAGLEQAHDACTPDVEPAPSLLGSRDGRADPAYSGGGAD